MTVLCFINCVMLAFFVSSPKVSQIEISRKPSSLLFCKDLFLEERAQKYASPFKNLPLRNLQPAELKQLAFQTAREHEAEIIQILRRTKPDHEGRVFFKVFEDEHVTVWAIEWENNGTAIHDHVSSQVGIHVLRGVVKEEHFQPPQATPFTRSLKEGKSVGLGGLPYVHRVSGEAGISIHAYSPPLKEMTYYEVDKNDGTLKATATWADDTP